MKRTIAIVYNEKGRTFITNETKEVNKEDIEILKSIIKKFDRDVVFGKNATESPQEAKNDTEGDIGSKNEKDPINEEIGNKKEIKEEGTI